MPTLRDLTKPKPKQATKLEDIDLKKFISPEKVEKTAKVYPSDKEFPIFPKDLKAPTLGKEDISAFKLKIKAFLSQNPHLKYLFYTKSYYYSERQYWFLNTETNTKIIVSDNDIKYRKHIAKRIGNGHYIDSRIFPKVESKTDNQDNN